jgi:hypothetical protein
MFHILEGMQSQHCNLHAFSWWSYAFWSQSLLNHALPSYFITITTKNSKSLNIIEGTSIISKKDSSEAHCRWHASSTLNVSKVPRATLLLIRTSKNPMCHLQKLSFLHQSAKPAYHLQHVHQKQVPNCNESNPEHHTWHFSWSFLSPHKWKWMFD